MDKDDMFNDAWYRATGEDPSTDRLFTVENLEICLKQGPNFFYEYSLDLHQKTFPQAVKLCAPRRYQVPHNYCNPIFWGAQMVTHLQLVKPSPDNFVSTTIQVVTWKLIDNQVPTFFVGKDFIEAVSQTEAPEELLLADLKWPLPAMLFVFPEDFMRDYIGHRVPFISVAKIAKGKHEGPQVKIGMEASPTIEAENDKLGITWNVVTKNLPVDYSSSYPLRTPVKTMIHPNSFCNAPIHHSKSAETLSKFAYLSDEIELDINARVNSLMVKLMMVMTARPTMVERGAMVRKARKVGTSKEKSEIWGPNVIGWKYRSPVRNPDAEKTGIKMRMHRRRGYTGLRYVGPKTADPRETVLRWIEPYWVNLPEDEKGEK